VLKRLAILLALLAVPAGGVADPSPSAVESGAEARATAIRVIVPGQDGSVSASVSAPPDAISLGGGFAYPADGSAVTSGAVSATASANQGPTATATATSEVTSLSLFGGEVTVASVVASARSTAGPKGASGDLNGSGVSGLVVLGQAVEAGAGQRVELGDWGYALVLQQALVPSGDGSSTGHSGFVTALDIHITVDHNGLPAGSEIQVGYAEASAQTRDVSPPTRPRGKGPASKTRPRALDPQRPTFGAPPIRRPPPNVLPKLTAGGYVFPVYGPASFTNSFGAPRATTGWHHGEDIFAPLGAPVIAVADGMVFSVGWNDIGGNRLWLRDGQGNEFYYAHLAAFSPLAVDGAYVNAGDVLGFVGATGDAEGTPYHLHFEIHPVSLLFMGYDGVAPPYPYLTAWRRLEDLAFAPIGWAPRSSSAAPKPGAILLHASDISSANGLDPGSLRRVLTDAAFAEGDGSLVFTGGRVDDFAPRPAGR
jgi:murein DD-endopeptidase MepM/ murein hydrolase activator NlpD